MFIQISNLFETLNHLDYKMFLILSPFLKFHKKNYTTETTDGDDFVHPLTDTLQHTF